jgi:hypothetical protein
METVTLSKSQFLVYTSYIFNERLETIDELKAYLEVREEWIGTDLEFTYEEILMWKDLAKEESDTYEVSNNLGSGLQIALADLPFRIWGVYTLEETEVDRKIHQIIKDCCQV